MVKLEDGREVFVDNVSNNGWNINSLSGALFLTSPNRIGLLSKDRQIHYRNILDACSFIEKSLSI